MNAKRWSLRLCSASLVAALVACANQPPVVISPFAAGSPTIQSVDVVLDVPNFVPNGGGLDALDGEGWSTGELERKFCNGLVERLTAAQVQARCVRSYWGKYIEFDNQQAQPASHVLLITPLQLSYMVRTSYGQTVSRGFNPSMETLTTIKDKQTNALVWRGKVQIVFAPVDSTGSRRYAAGLIDVLRTSGAIPEK